MSLKFHEIANANHQIINPFTDDQLILLGDICGLNASTSLLDLCCGKAEMLGRWSTQYGIQGVGVDISKIFLEAAQNRINELGVASNITLIEADAATYPTPEHEYDIVSCIGASWIGNGLEGTLQITQQALQDENSLLLIGEPFWHEDPPVEAYQSLTDGDRDLFVTLPKTLDRFEHAGFELIEMVLADHQGWDRYEAMEWKAVFDWLQANPDDPDVPELRQWITNKRRTYLTYGRRYFGWGVFVLRQM